MSAHTPGPWGCSFESVDPEWAVVTTLGGLVIANVNADFRQKANARLIASAPELLEALQSLIDMDIAYQRGPKVSDAVDKARAAIAKATRGLS